MPVGCPLETAHRGPSARRGRGQTRSGHIYRGGHETIAISVKWALYLIGLHPEVQERIHQELDRVLGSDSKGPLAVADLNELKYLSVS
ncbi:hypothetical protein CEXT_216351 [Caerostris extrusa]|uniref:Cytochrome P450 n=1 Tax=Caerostris extrusa TaxID=172846 RepID=A0AAV4Y3E7_CAEEX|nr:hypothetical protein CEXT_216351 [Caerostris extrusa]